MQLLKKTCIEDLQARLLANQQSHKVAILQLVLMLLLQLHVDQIERLHNNKICVVVVKKQAQLIKETLFETLFVYFFQS